MYSILLVDDSGLFKEIGGKIPTQVECRLLTAGSGSEALSVARRERPDLIYLDAEMIGMTGIDVCRVLKADSQFAHTPVLVVSDPVGATEQILRAGADAWLFKPLEETAFFESMRRHLRLSSREANRSVIGCDITFWRDGMQHEGTLRDLSRGGFFIRTAVRQPIGARLEVSFEVPGGKPGRMVVAEALIVRAADEPHQGLGCRLFRISEGPRIHLEECLRMLEGESASEARVVEAPQAGTPES